MITRPISFIQICCNTDHIYGLDEKGDVWYRDKPPYSTHSVYSAPNISEKDKAAAKEEARTWKPFEMKAKVKMPESGPMRDAQSTTDDPDVVIDEPKIYTDQTTIIAVQTALMAEKYNLKADGLLGNITTNHIRSIQAKHKLPQTGLIDDNLLEALKIVLKKEEPVQIKPIETIDATLLDNVNNNKVETSYETAI